VREPDVDEVLGRAFDRHLVARLAGLARPQARLLGATALLFPLIAGLELLQPYLLKVAIDEHILHGDWPGLTGVAGLFLAVLLTLAGLRALEAYLLQLTGQRVMHDIRGLLFRHLVRLEAAFFDRNPVGRLMSRVLNDAWSPSCCGWTGGWPWSPCPSCPCWVRWPPSSGCVPATPTGRCASGWPASPRSCRSRSRA
jgi:hypothetical protein